MSSQPISAMALPGDRRHDVCCVGTALVDHLSFTGEGLLDELGLPKATMTLIDMATARRIRGSVGEARVVSGGTVANTAAGVASLGGRPVYVGAVADDDLGERYRADLLDSGVRAVLETLPGESDDEGTGACFVLITEDAERTMATALGVSGRLHHDLVTDELLGECQIAYFDGYLLDFPDSEAITGRLVAASAATGCLLALGLADILVVERHHDRLRALLGLVDVVFCNEAEACAMTATPTVADAMAALGRPGLLIVVTCGPAGAILRYGDVEVHVDAAPVDEVVDLTGAGDLFAGGVLYGLCSGLDLEGSGRLGALAAAEVISHLGARPARPLAELVAEAS